jgi:hypothetical protein
MNDKQTALSNTVEQALPSIKTLLFEPSNLFLFLFLVIIGIALKSAKKFPDWGIIFAVLGLGFLGGYGYLYYTMHTVAWVTALMLGGIDAVFAVLGHQILKQVLESPLGPIIAAIPGMGKTVTVAAAFSGATVSKVRPAPKKSGTGTGDGSTTTPPEDSSPKPPAA